MKGILWLATKSQNPSEETIFPNLPRHFHVTLQFGADRAQFEHILGKEVEVRVKAVCTNDRIQALSVDLPEDIKPLCKNKHPHITLSMANGVKPVESNAMLEGDHNWFPVFYTLPTVVEFSPF